jgi:uncharacterized protein (TIGR00725 family)
MQGQNETWRVLEMIIGVIGGSRVDRETGEMAYEVGRLLAEREALVVCGGMGGVMEAVCQGVADAEGVSVGILPSDDTTEANYYVSVPIATGMGIARNFIIARTAEVIIAIDGGYGTLSEIAIALNLGKPVIAVNSWELEKAGLVDTELFIRAVSAEDAVEKAFRFNRG